MASILENFTGSVTVIKNLNGYIFGGFTSVPWSSTGGFKTHSTAFLFSLTNPSNTPLKLKVKSPQNAVYHSSSNGPTFGSGHDLYVSSSSYTNRNSFKQLNSNQFPNGISITEGGKFIVEGSDLKFQALEIDVFQILNFFH